MLYFSIGKTFYCSGPVVKVYSFSPLTRFQFIKYRLDLSRSLRCDLVKQDLNRHA